MIPPFIIADEQVISENEPELAPCQLKYESLVAPSLSRIIGKTASYSEKWGYVLRVVFKAKVEERELSTDQIFLCWKTRDGPANFVVSPLDEEHLIRNDVSKP